MSGQWPPEWEDSVPGSPRESGRYPGPGADTQLSEVSAALASVATPALPDVFGARISAAIAAEAAARAADSTADSTVHGAVAARDTASGAGADPVSGGSRLVRPRAHGVPRAARRARQGRRFRPVLAIGSAVACLLLIAVGYTLSGRGSSSGVPGSAAVAAGGAATSQNASGAKQAFAQPRPGQIRQASGKIAGFTVTRSGIGYSRATLASQVRRELAAPGVVLRPSAGSRSSRDSSAHAVPGPAAAMPSATGATAPSPALAACVLRLTGNVTPSLVDRATYMGRAVYVIAVPSRVWVVGLGCTAARPGLITSVPLAG